LCDRDEELESLREAFIIFTQILISQALEPTFVESLLQEPGIIVVVVVVAVLTHGSGRKRGRPTKTWRSTFKEDLVDRGVDWNSVRAVATDRHRWRILAAHCPDKDWRI